MTGSARTNEGRGVLTPAQTAEAEVLARLFELASERFGRPRAELSAELDFYDALGIDSMEALSLLSALEQRFGVEVPDYEVQDARTFRDLAQAIARRL